MEPSGVLPSSWRLGAGGSGSIDGPSNPGQRSGCLRARHTKCRLTSTFPSDEFRVSAIPFSTRKTHGDPPARDHRHAGLLLLLPHAAVPLPPGPVPARLLPRRSGGRRPGPARVLHPGGRPVRGHGPGRSLELQLRRLRGERPLRALRLRGPVRLLLRRGLPQLALQHSRRPRDLRDPEGPRAYRRLHGRARHVHRHGGGRRFRHEHPVHHAPGGPPRGRALYQPQLAPQGDPPGPTAAAPR